VHTAKPQRLQDAKILIKNHQIFIDKPFLYFFMSFSKESFATSGLCVNGLYFSDKL